MNRINQRYRYVLDTISNHLTLEEFSELIHSIKIDPISFIGNIAEQPRLQKNPLLLEKIEAENDLCNVKIREYLTYCLTKGEDPREKLIETYLTLTKNILSAEFIGGNFKSVSFERIPEHPIARISFSDEKNVTIKANNNIIELVV